MFIAHTATAFWHHFPPWIIKNMDLETVSHFGTPNHRKSKSMPKVSPKMLPKSNLKSIKLDLRASVFWDWASRFWVTQSYPGSG